MNEVYTGAIHTSGSFSPSSQRMLRSKVNSRANRIPTALIELMQDCRLYSATQEATLDSGKERIMEEVGDNAVMIADFLRSWMPSHRARLFLVQFLTGTPQLRWGKKESLEKEAVLAAFNEYLSTIRFPNPEEEELRRHIIENLEELKTKSSGRIRKPKVEGKRKGTLISFSDYAKPFSLKSLEGSVSFCSENLKWLMDDEFCLQFEEAPIRVFDVEVTLRCKLRLPEAILGAISDQLQRQRALGEVIHSSYERPRKSQTFSSKSESSSRPGLKAIHASGIRDISLPVRPISLSKEEIINRIIEESEVALNQSTAGFKTRARKTLSYLRDMASHERSEGEGEFSQCLEELVNRRFIYQPDESEDTYSLTEEGCALMEYGLSRWILIELSYSSPK